MKKFLVVFLLFTLLVSCSKKEENKKEIKKSYKTVFVSTGSVNEIENFIGYTRGIEQVMLATKAPGRITYLAKNIGDKVYSGELLTSLGSEEARNGFNTAQNIVNKLNNLKLNTRKALDEQINAMKVKIESIKAQIKGVDNGLLDTKNITQAQLKTARTGLETAKTNLEKTTKELEAKKESILTGAKTALTHFSIISTNSMDFVEKLLGLDPKDDDFNNKIDDYLGMKNVTQLRKTEKLYKEVLPSYKEFKKFYKTKIEDKNPTEEDIIKALQMAKTLGDKITGLLDETYTVVDNSIENVYFSMNMINDLKKQISTLGANLEQTLLSTSGDMLLGISGSLENLRDFETQKEKALTLLKKQIELAEKQVKQYEAMATGKVNEVSTKQEVMNIGLQEAQVGLQALIAKKEATLREIDAKITEAIGKKNEANVMINNGNIIAPFSGIITNKMAEEGQVINAGMPIYELADTSKIKVKLQVPEYIKNNLSIGDKIEVNFEENNKTYLGKIINISLAANPINKKFEVEIALDNKNGKIEVGKMAIVSFGTDIKEKKGTGAIRIPNNAIIEKFMVPGVYILEGNKVKFKNIKIKKMGEYFSEVEGLKLGDKIITSGKENLYDGEVLE